MNEHETLGQRVSRLVKQERELIKAGPVGYRRWLPWVKEAGEVVEFLLENTKDLELYEMLQLAHAHGSMEVALRTDVRLHEEEQQEKLERAEAIREGRLREDLGDSPPDVQEKAAAEAHRLKAHGVRDFRKRVADEYEVVPETIRRWMDKYPPNE